MAFYHKVTIVRASGRVTKRFSSTYDSPYDQVGNFVRHALAMPKTVRVEVEETDTQLYGYPMAQRSYPRAVALKNGRAYVFHGHGANTAWLLDSARDLRLG